MRESNDSALYLAWVFFKSNLAVSFSIIGILFLLMMFSFVPIIGFISSILISFVGITIGAFFAKAVIKAKTPEEMVEIAKSTTVKSLLMDNMSVAIGVYLASLIVFIIAFIVIGLLGSLVANDIAYFQYTGHVSATAIILMIIDLALILILFYIYPAVIGHAYMSDDFTDAFKKVFLMLNPSFWKKTFNVRYMILVFIWMLVFPTAFLLAFISMFVLIGFILLFILLLYSSAIYGYAYLLSK